jgi:hypothetical protein
MGMNLMQGYFIPFHPGLEIILYSLVLYSTLHSTDNALHKKGAQDQVENYRSIAKQSVFSKILELGIRPQIQNYRKTEGFTSPSQHEFTAKKSINTGLFNFLKPLYLDLDLKRHCVVVSFYIRKAFDSVDKRILLNEIKIMNAEPEVLKFFNSYLSGRSQVVDLSLENHVTSHFDIRLAETLVLCSSYAICRRH